MPTKKACVFNTSGSYFFYACPLTSAILLFLCYGADFSIISLTEYIAVSAMPMRVLHSFCIRVWDYPNKRKRTRPGRGRGGPFFGSVATLPMINSY